ncbi:mitochondrial inner membrane protease subunit 2 [Citrus sinensis]|uniref:Mitochondrial inner membrane protease subunit 2 n=1 Tax=Citrus sinensis TaxID=2711 RepID=A0ACB8K2Q8_CITSI|nr:mitochondrial inner membrane protease subunit 2 [Citrus sinensis]
MAAQNFLWSFTKNCFTFGLIGLTISDRYASIVPVRGSSMSPTFNLTTDSFMGSLSDDYVLVEKFCLQKYKFSHGDVIVFCSPSNHKEKHVKRIIGLPGDWIGTPMTNDVMKVPNGHCWVEGDNPSSSLDSRSFGPEALMIKEYNNDLPNKFNWDTLHAWFDDLPCLDNDDFRRGKRANRKIFGEATTAPACQALLCLAIEHISTKTKNVSPDRLLQAIVEICSALDS